VTNPLDDLPPPPPDPNDDFTFISLADLLDKPDVEYRFTVSDLLPVGGTSLLVAKPKVGKSLLARQLAACVATGEPFLEKEVRQGLVLYLAFEDKDEEVKIEYKARGTDRDAPLHFAFGSAPRDAEAKLRAVIERLKPSLVVIDTLSYYIGVDDIKDYTQVSGALRPLHAIARASDSHIMVVHHAGKNGDERGAIDSPLGSTALTGSVDTIIAYAMEGDDARIIQTRQRIGESMPKTRLLFDKETFTLTVGDTVGRRNAKEMEEEILAIIGDGRLSQSDIAKEVKGRRQLLLQTLTRLVDDMSLIRLGTGKRGNEYLYERAGSSAGSADEMQPFASKTTTAKDEDDEYFSV